MSTPVRPKPAYGPLPENSFDQITHFPGSSAQIFLGSRPRRIVEWNTIVRDDLPKIRAANIKYVISVVEPEEMKPSDYNAYDYRQEQIEFFSFPTHNHRIPAPSLLAKVAEKGTELLKKNKGNILVHCSAGISRSAKAVYWILRFDGHEPKEILQWMKARPTSIERDGGKQSQEDCERWLSSCRNTHKCVMYRSIE